MGLLMQLLLSRLVDHAAVGLRNYYTCFWMCFLLASSLLTDREVHWWVVEECLHEWSWWFCNCTEWMDIRVKVPKGILVFSQKRKKGSEFRIHTTIILLRLFHTQYFTLVYLQDEYNWQKKRAYPIWYKLEKGVRWISVWCLSIMCSIF